MRDVRKIGRRTWLARAGGALAVWTSLRIGGRDGWAISLGMPATPVAHAQGPDHAGHEGQPPADIRRIPLGQNGFTTSYVVVRGGEAVIVDTGVAGSLQRIGEVVQDAGLGWDAVRHLILTHHHSDHTGSASHVLGAATGAMVWAGAADIPSFTPRARSRRPRTAPRCSGCGYWPRRATPSATSRSTTRRPRRSSLATPSTPTADASR